MIQCCLRIAGKKGNWLEIYPIRNWYIYNFFELTDNNFIRNISYKELILMKDIDNATTIRIRNISYKELIHGNKYNNWTKYNAIRNISYKELIQLK